MEGKFMLIEKRKNIELVLLTTTKTTSKKEEKFDALNSELIALHTVPNL